MDWFKFTSSMRLQLISSVARLIKPVLTINLRDVRALSVVHFSNNLEINMKKPMRNQPRKIRYRKANNVWVQ